MVEVQGLTGSPCPMSSTSSCFWRCGWVGSGAVCVFRDYFEQQLTSCKKNASPTVQHLHLEAKAKLRHLLPTFSQNEGRPLISKTASTPYRHSPSLKCAATCRQFLTCLDNFLRVVLRDPRKNFFTRRRSFIRRLCEFGFGN